MRLSLLRCQSGGTRRSPGLALLGVRVHEKADKEIGQRCEVKAVCKNSPDFLGAGEAGDHAWLRVHSNRASVLHHLTSIRRGGGIENGSGSSRGEVDEEVDGSSGSTNDELCDLKGGEGALKSVGDADVEG